MKTICVDARILPIFGMGSVLRQLLYLFREQPIRWRALVNKDCKDFLWDWVEPIWVDYRINSMKEQIYLPFHVPICDLFWSPNYNIPLLPTLARKRMVTMHDIFCFTYPVKKPSLKLACAKHLLKKAARLSHTVITSSAFSKQAICKYTKVHESKVQVIPLAVDKSVFLPTSNLTHAKQILSENYHLKKKFLLYVGRLATHKNEKFLCKAFERLHLLGFKDIDLVFVGKYQGCSEQQLLKQQLLTEFPAVKNHMHFIGPISEEHLAYFYQTAEGLIFPSTHEGFGLPPLEAMSSGCPCIVSNATSIPEVCKEGVLYFNPYDLEAFLPILIELLQSPKQREELKSKGLQQSKNFCWVQTAQQYLSIIDNLITI